MNLFALALWLLPFSARAEKAVPPAPAFVFNDGVISPDSEKKLSTLLELSQKATKRRFVVALFRSLDGEPLADYTSRLYREWRLGIDSRPGPRETPKDAVRRLGPSKDREGDGLLFCLFLQERKWRIEVGYKLAKTLPEERAMELIRTFGEPEFQRGRIGSGVYVSAAALAKEIGAPVALNVSSASPAAMPPAPAGGSSWRDRIWGGAALFFSGAGIAYFAWLFLDGYWEKRDESGPTRQP